MLMKLIDYLHDCFKPPRVHMPMSDKEQVALTNLIQVSKERLWLAESYPKRPGPSFDYTETLENSDIDTINQSLKIATELLNKHKQHE